MAEANPAGTPQAPVFRMQKMYIRDLSFESPHAPRTFLKAPSDSRMTVDLKLQHRPIADDRYEVALTLTIRMLDRAEGDRALYTMELEHAGLFLMRGIPEGQRERVLSVDGPFMLFPYTRQLVSRLSLDAGFAPFVLEPINFVGLYNQLQRQKREKTGA